MPHCRNHIATRVQVKKEQHWKREAVKQENQDWFSKEVTISYQLKSTNPGRIFSKNLCSSADMVTKTMANMLYSSTEHINFQTQFCCRAFNSRNICNKYNKQTGKRETFQTINIS